MYLGHPLLLRKKNVEEFGRVDFLRSVGSCWLKSWRTLWLLLAQFAAVAGPLSVPQNPEYWGSASSADVQERGRSSGDRIRWDRWVPPRCGSG